MPVLSRQPPESGNGFDVELRRVHRARIRFERMPVEIIAHRSRRFVAGEPSERAGEAVMGRYQVDYQVGVVGLRHDFGGRRDHSRPDHVVAGWQRDARGARGGLGERRVQKRRAYRAAADERELASLIRLAHVVQPTRQTQVVRHARRHPQPFGGFAGAPSHPFHVVAQKCRRPRHRAAFVGAVHVALDGRAALDRPDRVEPAPVPVISGCELDLAAGIQQVIHYPRLPFDACFGVSAADREILVEFRLAPFGKPPLDLLPFLPRIRFFAVVRERGRAYSLLHVSPCGFAV